MYLKNQKNQCISLYKHMIYMTCIYKPSSIELLLLLIMAKIVNEKGVKNMRSRFQEINKWELCFSTQFIKKNVNLQN